MSAFDEIERAFGYSCFRQAKKLMITFVHHYRHIECVSETIQDLDRRIEWAIVMKQTLPALYDPQRILRLRAKRYVLRRHSSASSSIQDYSA